MSDGGSKMPLRVGNIEMEECSKEKQESVQELSAGLIWNALCARGNWDRVEISNVKANTNNEWWKVHEIAFLICFEFENEKASSLYLLHDLPSNSYPYSEILLMSVDAWKQPAEFGVSTCELWETLRWICKMRGFYLNRTEIKCVETKLKLIGEVDGGKAGPKMAK